MEYDFDQLIERRNTDSAKWSCLSPDIIPLTGAEMEFSPPRPVLQALRRRLEHPMFGYSKEPPELREVVTARLQRVFGWKVKPEALVFLPGVVSGMNLACRALAIPGDSALAVPPTYTPILDAPLNAGLTRCDAQLVRDSTGRYVMDFDALEAAVTDRTRILMFCNPHNPVGRVYRKDELERLAEICLRHNMTICSDEIYCDWVFGGGRHMPIASIDPEVAQCTVTLIGTSKSHNLAGIKCGIAIIENETLRERFCAIRTDLVPEVNSLEYLAAFTAYRDGQSWQDAVLLYLEDNRQTMDEMVKSRLPGITMQESEGGPIAWLDCRQAGIPGNPRDFFLTEGRVALNDGAVYGCGGAGFVRLAFACPRSLLTEGLARMSQAIERLLR